MMTASNPMSPRTREEQAAYIARLKAQNKEQLRVMEDVNDWLCRNKLNGTGHQQLLNEAIAIGKAESLGGKP